MKLTTRRRIRQWFLDAPYGTLYGLLGLGVALIVLGVFTETDSLILIGFVGSLGVYYAYTESKSDSCPTCRSLVYATSERYCSTCGTRLDELHAAPPIDDRVEERFRPVGLEEYERESTPVDAPVPVADGGDTKENEGGEVSG